MGLISLPIMLRYGYDRRVATGVIAASGTLAQIIPPSLVLIVMADQLGRSVGDMYEGAFIPGLVLAGLYAVYIFIVTKLCAARPLPACRRTRVGFREPDGSRGPDLAGDPRPSYRGRRSAIFTMRDAALSRRRFRRPDAWPSRIVLCVLVGGAELDHRQDHRIAFPVGAGRSRSPSSWCRRCS